MKNVSDEKPQCSLTTCDGNVFAIIGMVSRSLKRAGLSERASEFQKRAMLSASYDAVLQLCFEFVEVT